MSEISASPMITEALRACMVTTSAWVSNRREVCGGESGCGDGTLGHGGVDDYHFTYEREESAATAGHSAIADNADDQTG